MLDTKLIYDIVQIVGSLFILVAFVASLLGRMKPSSYTYLITNTVGSAVLTVTAVIAVEWGFIMLEGVWSLASLISIIRKVTGRTVASPH